MILYKLKNLIKKELDSKNVYQFPIRLDTATDVKNFTDKVSSVEEDVELVGKDEFGQPWVMNAKSFLNSITLASIASQNKERNHNAHEVDYNTLHVVCEKDISSLLNEFVPLSK